MDYEKIYSELMDEYKTGMVAAETIGEAIVKLAHCFAEANFIMVNAEKKRNHIAREMEGQTDASGKSLSSTKAAVMTAASEESYLYDMARANVQNIEQYINSLKSLQKGVLGEYANSSY